MSEVYAEALRRLPRVDDVLIENKREVKRQIFCQGFEFAEKEMIKKLRMWVDNQVKGNYYTFGYISRHFKELLKEIMEDE